MKSKFLAEISSDVAFQDFISIVVDFAKRDSGLGNWNIRHNQSLRSRNLEVLRGDGFVLRKQFMAFSNSNTFQTNRHIEGVSTKYFCDNCGSQSACPKFQGGNLRKSVPPYRKENKFPQRAAERSADRRARKRFPTPLMLGSMHRQNEASLRRVKRNQARPRRCRLTRWKSG